MLPNRSVTEWSRVSDRVSVIHVTVRSWAMGRASPRLTRQTRFVLPPFLSSHNQLPAWSPGMVDKYKANHGMSPLEAFQRLPSSSCMTCRHPEGLQALWPALRVAATPAPAPAFAAPSAPHPPSDSPHPLDSLLKEAFCGQPIQRSPWHWGEEEGEKEP